MSANPIISVHNVSKRYTIGRAPRHDTLRDALSHGIRGLWSMVSWSRGPFSRGLSTADFWALRDVSFEVRPGEVVGIIGRNGAGKSTLLKILSRITEPTEGRVTLRGRVASLLEVGTGFHPELSGRENIFLNGAILGMTRAEIRRKFDEIVAFAEVEQFLDTPVKRYSSGMYVRLAFAVAAHLEPEILIVDEVLAVGDAQFQRKCLGKMRDVTQREGRTVLFVSHQIPVVRQLCRTAMLLRQGRLVAHGYVGQVAASYEASFAETHQCSYRCSAPSVEKACYFESIDLSAAKTDVASYFRPDRPVDIRFVLVVNRSLSALQIAMRVSTFSGQPVFTTTNADAARKIPGMGAGRHRFAVTIPPLLAAGAYKLTLAAVEPHREVYDLVDDTITFEIDRVGSLAGDLRDDRAGLVEPSIVWHHEPAT